MVRVCKADGLIVLTCATFGRREHGTTRRHAHASPFTVSKGWNHYQNLRARDFEEHGLVEPLAEWRFLENWRP